MTVEIRALRKEDNRNSLKSGDPDLDVYFLRYAGQNQFRHHIGVTYVAVEGDRILGYATVSPGILDAGELPSGRKMPPYPLPVLRLARLAVDEQAQGLGLGRKLLRFCIELAERMMEDLGCVGLVVDAKPQAVEFYRALGFQELHVIEGASAQRPAPLSMFISLGSVPKPRAT